MRRNNLTVRIVDGIRDRHVTDYVSDFKFRKVAPGGHHSLSCTLNLPRDTFPDLNSTSRVYIYDSRSAETVWEGYVANPGAVDGAGGQSWDLSAVGGMSRASDERRSLVYIDAMNDLWQRAPLATSPPSAAAEAATDPDAVLPDGLLCRFPPGSPIATNATAQIDYSFTQTDMTWGAFQVTYKSGKSDSGYAVEFATDGGASPSDSFALGAGMSTTQAAANRWVGESGHPPYGRTHVAFRIRRTGGATNVADETTWSFFNVKILGHRRDQYGQTVPGAAGMVSNTYVRADWVVADLVGRNMIPVDREFASISTSPQQQIDQLAYREAVSGAQVLEDLELHEPDYLWEILEGDGSKYGMHRFAYRPWPTTARYEISTSDGYDAPGGDTDLRNRIVVNWTDSKGVPRVTVRTSAVPEFDTILANWWHDADPVTLPPGLGSDVNAARIGDQILASLNSPPKAATASVRRPIMDYQTGRLVMPWEILPGYLVRVRETGDLLRLTEMEYSDDDCTATLTLGTPVLSLEQRVARLARPR